MKYMLMIYQGTTPLPGTPEWALLSEAQRQAVLNRHRAVERTPGATPAVQMSPPEKAVTVRVRDGRALSTDGPVDETREAMGGYLVYETDDPASAVELAARLPAASMGGAVEIRPLVER